LSPKVARLFALQMVAVVGALALVLAFVVYNTRPNHPLQTTGGIDPINVAITWIAFFGILFALAMVHIIFARQLFSEARGTRRGIASW
jgi:hypothetical protein